MQGKKVILVGFPGGPVCVEKHIPGYIAQVRCEGRSNPLTIRAFFRCYLVVPLDGAAWCRAGMTPWVLLAERHARTEW